MTYNEKKSLYESIMKDVAKTVKRQINEAGVASLKIEGRMKAEYYIAQVVKTYRQLIDEIYVLGDASPESIDYYNRELLKAENRPSDSGFLSGICDDSKSLYGVNGAGVTHDYVGIVRDFYEERGIAKIEVKNMFDTNDVLEAFGPQLRNTQFINKNMYDKDYHLINEAHKPAEIVYIRVPFRLSVNDMLRKIS